MLFTSISYNRRNVETKYKGLAHARKRLHSSMGTTHETNTRSVVTVCNAW